MKVLEIRRHLLFVCTTIVFSVVCTFAAFASDYSNLFVVKDIAVDKTASSASVAREQAVLEAERRAYATVLKRITMPIDADRLPVPSTEELVNLVKDVSIANEKTSSVRYIATLQVRFKADLIKDLLQEHSIPYVNDMPKPAVILPVFNTGADNYFWDEGNTWFAFLKGKKFDSSFVPLIVPLGDETDMEYTSGTVNTKELLKRYNAGYVFLAEMKKANGFFTVSVNPLDDAKKTFNSFNLKVSAEGDETKVFDAILKTMSEKIDNDWRDNNVVHFAKASSIIVIVPINNITDWLKIKKRLDKVSVINRYDLQAMRQDKIQLTIFFGRGLDRLVSDLAGEKLELKQAGSGLWVMSDMDNKNIVIKSEKAPESDADVSVFGIDDAKDGQDADNPDNVDSVDASYNAE